MLARGLLARHFWHAELTRHHITRPATAFRLITIMLYILNEEHFFLENLVFVLIFGLNKLPYINKMITLTQLKEILKENQITGYSNYTKSKLIDLLDKRGLIPEKYDVLINK